MPVTDGEALDKWHQLAASLRSDSEILARCRTDAAHCPQAAKKFLAVIADGRAREGRARLGVINRAINLAIRPTGDLAQWGVADRWSAPLTTFESWRGDCKDYRIAKYVPLRETGMADSELRLIILRDLKAARIVPCRRPRRQHLGRARQSEYGARWRRSCRSCVRRNRHQTVRHIGGWRSTRDAAWGDCRRAPAPGVKFAARSALP